MTNNQKALTMQEILAQEGILISDIQEATYTFAGFKVSQGFGGEVIVRDTLLRKFECVYARPGDDLRASPLTEVIQRFMQMRAEQWFVPDEEEMWYRENGHLLTGDCW